MISVLIGCGLRRSELVALEMEHVQTRQGHWAIVDLVGKGGHIRTVPMPQWVKHLQDTSRTTTILRCIRMCQRRSTLVTLLKSDDTWWRDTFL